MFPQDIAIDKHTISMDGISLLPLMAGRVEKIREYAVTGHYGRQWSIRNQDWSYLLPIDGSNLIELYDRQNDPTEQRNVANIYPEIAAHLELELRRFVAGLNPGH
jgi:arylsulfatase A-like enzyme